MNRLRRVLVVGVDDARLLSLGLTVVAIDSPQLAQAIETSNGGCVAVLGDGPLRTRDYSEVVRALRAPNCIPLACPTDLEPEWLVQWARASALEFVSPSNLPSRVIEAVRIPMRSSAPVEDWALAGWLNDPTMARALRTLARIAALTVQSWAMALGVSRFSLHRLCKRECKVTPERIVWVCLREVVRQEESQGLPLRDIAPLVGYANEYSLRRALARRWKLRRGR